MVDTKTAPSRTC